MTTKWHKYRPCELIGNVNTTNKTVSISHFDQYWRTRAAVHPERKNMAHF